MKSHKKVMKKNGKTSKKYSNLSKNEISFIKEKLNITTIQEIDTVILKQLKENLKN